MYWNLYFITSSTQAPNVPDEVRFNVAAQASVPLGARVFLCQHCAEMLWDSFWSVGRYPELSSGRPLRLSGRHIGERQYIDEEDSAREPDGAPAGGHVFAFVLLWVPNRLSLSAVYSP
jgi:hypothetical protein